MLKHSSVHSSVQPSKLCSQFLARKNTKTTVVLPLIYEGKTLVDYLRIEGAKQSPEKRTMGFRWLWLFTAVRNRAAPPTGSS